MLIDRTTIPEWVIKNARLPDKLFGPTEDCEGADFAYCISTAMYEDIERQENLELELDKPLLVERKWYRIWFKKNNLGYFHSCIPESYAERLFLVLRLRCIYKRLQKNNDSRKEFVRIMARALDY